MHVNITRTQEWSRLRTPFTRQASHASTSHVPLRQGLTRGPGSSTWRIAQCTAETVEETPSWNWTILKKLASHYLASLRQQIWSPRSQNKAAEMPSVGSALHIYQGQPPKALVKDWPRRQAWPKCWRRLSIGSGRFAQQKVCSAAVEDAVSTRGCKKRQKRRPKSQPWYRTPMPNPIDHQVTEFWCGAQHLLLMMNSRYFVIYMCVFPLYYLYGCLCKR